MVAFLSGTQAGLAWQRASKHGRKRGYMDRTSARQSLERGKKSEWIVEGQAHGSEAQARKAASDALHSMDGQAKGRLTVECGTARFEVAGGVPSGFVCHRNVDAANEGSWAALTRSGQAKDESVDVSVGKAKGFMPLRLINDLESVEAALDNFFKTPASSSFGPIWVTGSEARQHA